MNVRQIRYIWEITKSEFNISRAAKALKTNQPGISKQVRLLEDELGFTIFKRRRSRLSGVTAEGVKVVAMAANIVKEMDNISAMSHDVRKDDSAPLLIAATHTQARYVLPQVMKRFVANHPNVRITMRQADAGRIIEMVEAGMADLGVTSEDPATTRSLLVLPCWRFQKVVIVPKDHELCRKKRITLNDLAEYPMVCYEPAFTAGRQVIEAFEKERLLPKITVIAIGADVVKTYVEEGLGIAVLLEATFDAKRDVNLQAIGAGHLFEPSTTKIFLSRDRYIRHRTYDFIELCESRWTRSNVQRLMTQSFPSDGSV
ncbi:MAG: LysR substrate-binding domain-containing protein [Gammaproteobacteria bacterium]|nr:LysR substrate-binding domain-containing protein [Gammaproteobacteria bacterium]